MAEKCTEYFANIGPTLASNIQNIAGNHLALITNRLTDSMFIPTLASQIPNIVGDQLALITTVTRILCSYQPWPVTYRILLVIT